MLKSLWIQFQFHSKFSARTSRQWKVQRPEGWHHWPLWTLHPLSPYLHPHPRFQSQSLEHQLSIRAGFLSLGTRLHYRDELSYCEGLTAPFCGRGKGFAGHWGIVRWPGFRGHFTHCLKSISRNASLADTPLFSAEGPLTATPSINMLNIFVHLCSSWWVYSYGHHPRTPHDFLYQSDQFVHLRENFEIFGIANDFKPKEGFYFFS